MGNLTMDEAINLDALVGATFHPLTDYELVLLMSRRFDHPRPARPTLLDADAFAFRLRFLREELEEFDEAHRAGDLEKAADALVDLSVVTLGTAIWMGLPWSSLFQDVMRANLEKVPGANAKRGGYGIDLVKPEGWQGPKTAELLRAWANEIERVEEKKNADRT